MSEQDRGLRIGCAGFGNNRRSYYNRFDLVEVQDTFFVMPRPAKVVRWRQEAPKGFFFALRAWQLITHEPDRNGYPRLSTEDVLDPGVHGHFRPTAEVQQALQQTLDCAEALEANAIVFETPPSFTPTVEHRANLSRFFEGIERKSRLLVWAARGVWDADEVARICEDLGIVGAEDPLASRPRERAYYRLQSSRYSDDDLMRVDEAAGACELACCVFNSLNMQRDAQRLKALVGDD